MMVKNICMNISKEYENLDNKLKELRRSIFIEIIGSPISNPKNWCEVSFDDTSLFKFGTGKPIRKENLDPNGKYWVYGANGKIGRHSEYLFDQNLIVIGRVGSYCGNVYTTTHKTWVTSNAITLQINESEFEIQYLAQMISMLNLSNFATGAAQQFLSLSTIKNLTVHKPPKTLQKEVSKFLIQIRKAEALLVERNNAIEKLIELQ